MKNNIKLYEVSPQYIDYLSHYEVGMYHNKQGGQHNNRKYIGVILEVNSVKYFAPLSSFKPKHQKMVEGLDFIKIRNYAVINLNKMFPVPEGCYRYVDIAKVTYPKYKSLLLAEYRVIKSVQDKIRKNAATLYNLKISGEVSRLTNRCNDFLLLEKLSREYK